MAMPRTDPGEEVIEAARSSRGTRSSKAGKAATTTDTRTRARASGKAKGAQGKATRSKGSSGRGSDAGAGGPPSHSRAGEALGLLLLSLALMATAALISLQFGRGATMGPFGRMLALSLYALLGMGGYLVVLAVGFIGLRTLIGRGRAIRWTVWMGYLGATVCGAVLFHLLFPRYVVHGFPAGGKGGEILGELLVALFSTAGTYLVTTVAMLLALMVATEASFVQTVLGVARIVTTVGARTRAVLRRTWQTLRRVFTWQAAPVTSAQADGSLALCPPAEPQPPPHERGDVQEAPTPAQGMEPEPSEPHQSEERELRIVEPKLRQRIEPGSLGTVIPVDPGGFELPSLDMLELPARAGQEIDRDSIETLAKRLERALNVFGIHGEVTEVHPGPVVTLYEFRPAPGTKLSKIESLDRDLALTLKATSVRVARIRGKDTVGIEVPNKQRVAVLIQELLADPVFAEANSLLTLALGKDISGAPKVCDLARAPHLLVAGSTGSGKSVGINVMLMSLLFRAKPDEVRLILIDPKMLEFSIYEDIPHLLLPVVTDPKHANQALRWAVNEMERRYQLMAEAGVRNLADYNAHVERCLEEASKQATESPAAIGAVKTVSGSALEDASQASPPVAQDPCAAATDAGAAPEQPEKLPYIVIVIDEFADLMMVAAKEVETSVARIAQKARAAGIHLVLATQRPSRDVITGLIKANFPSRLSFQVSSKVDSRVILDRNGAEALLGQGDMLFMATGKAPDRLQGAFVSTSEVMRVVEFLKEQANPAYNLDILKAEEDDVEDINMDADKDALYDKALFLVTQSRRASTSWIQRQLRIGYNRAARILEIMEREGVVGPQQPGARNRDVLAPPPPDL